MDVAFEMARLVGILEKALHRDPLETWNEDARAAFCALIPVKGCQGPLHAAEQAVSFADFMAKARKERK